MYDSRFDSADNLFKTGCFSTKKELANYLILDELAQKDGPIGSAKLRIAMLTKGYKISEANIGRYLVELDAMRYTAVQKTQGRILTQAGRDFISMKKEEISEKKIQAEYLKVFSLDNFNDLVSLLEIRRLLETEAVEKAVHNADENDEKRLNKNLTDHRLTQSIGGAVAPLGLDFHYKIAAASHNTLLEILISVLLSAEGALEAKRKQLLTREMGAQYQLEHEEICKAIFQNRNVEQARKAMYDHITVLIEGVKKTNIVVGKK